jgi:peptidoglycan-associated lipoprotein
MQKNFLAAASLAILLSACGSQPPAPEQKAAPTEQGKPTTVETPPPVTPVTPSKVEESGLSPLKDPHNVLSKRSIYFDFDSFVVKDEYKPLVEAHAKYLTRTANAKMLIQGNADERGSREYNLALGQKRAEALKSTLHLLGAKEDQLEAVSLGKEKPRCTESTESCWAQNRRDDMLYSGEY